MDGIFRFQNVPTSILKTQEQSKHRWKNLLILKNHQLVCT